MSEKADFNKIIDHIEKLKKLEIPIVKREEEKFNFFSAIVSGRRERNHIEFYHSNFIAHLLDKNGNHKKGDLFLKEFLNLRQIRNGNIEFNINQDYQVEREKPAKGNIDIFISSKDWIIFIENKLRSSEGFNQVKDYCDWLKENSSNKQWIGFYLTKDGHEPQSILKGESNEYRSKVFSISYKDIIDWLNTCLEKEKGNPNLKTDQQIRSAIEQYISVIKHELNLDQMEANKDALKEIDDHFKDPEILSNMINVISQFSKLSESLELFISSKRKLFLKSLGEKIYSSINDDQIVQGLEVYKSSLNQNNDNEYEIFVKCEKLKLKFKIRIRQAYPGFEDGGRGLWWGVYPSQDDSVFKIENLPLSKLELEKKMWEPIKLKVNNKDYEDFEKNTDEGSAYIVEAENGNNELKEELQKGIIDRILDKLGKLNGIQQ